MAGGVGEYFGERMLYKLLGATDFTPPGTWYAALFTAAPTDAGGGTEVTGGSYGRIAVTNNTTNFPLPSGSAEVDSGADINFGTASASWGTVVAFALFDASSGGHMGVWGLLSVPTLINTGSSFKITTSNLIVTQA